MLRDIQHDIVAERNNFGDYSVCGDDLALAAAAAVLLMTQGPPEVRERLLREAEAYREVIVTTMPAVARGLAGN